MGALRSTAFVLVVDDDTACARVLERILRGSRIEPLVATSADDALGIIDSRGTLLDGALLDVMIPGTHGTELAAKIHSKNRRATISFVSAVEEHSIRETMVAENAILIRKPIAAGEVKRWADGIVARAGPARLERVLDALARERGLTAREVDLLRAAHARSPSYKSISAALGISVNSVHTHAGNIRRKTGASSLRELVDRLDVDADADADDVDVDVDG